MSSPITFQLQDERTGQYLSCIPDQVPAWALGSVEEGAPWGSYFSVQRYGPNGFYQIVNTSGLALGVSAVRPNPDGPLVFTVNQNQAIPYSNSSDPSRGFAEAAQSWVIAPHTGSIAGSPIYSLYNTFAEAYLSNDGTVQLTTLIDFAVRFNVNQFVAGAASRPSVAAYAYDSPPKTTLILEGADFDGYTGPFKAGVTAAVGQPMYVGPVYAPLLTTSADGPSPVMTVALPSFVEGTNVVAALVEDSAQNVLCFVQR